MNKEQIMTTCWITQVPFHILYMYKNYQKKLLFHNTKVCGSMIHSSIESHCCYFASSLDQINFDFNMASWSMTYIQAIW